MREVNAKQITEVVKKLCIDSNLYLGEDVLAALDRGEKMEEGTHQELLTKRGLYYRLYQLQFRD